FPSGEFPPDGFPDGEFPSGEFPGGEVPDIVVPDFGDEFVTEEAGEFGNADEPGDDDLNFGEEAPTTGDDVDIDGEQGGEAIPPTDIDELENSTSGENAGDSGNTENTRPSAPPVERSAEVEPTP